MSTRTMVRDSIVSEFETMQRNKSGRLPDFGVSLRWLADTETKQANTYCVIVTDETRRTQTHEEDAYELSGAVVLYAYDTKDARAKLDLMIEDALDVLRRAFRVLGAVLQNASIDTITTTEASTAEGDWPQAVIRWSCIHQRAGMV